jgi:hypothetical protein
MVGAVPEWDLVDAVTPLGLDILDELCVALTECLLAAQGAQDQIGLNLEELLEALSAVQRPAWSAYRAASLLHQGAALDRSWSPHLSRPKAIFARHQAAVRQGARPIAPRDPSPARLHDTIGADACLDRTQDISDVRPRCAAHVAKTADRCKNSAIYLGSAVFAQHCYAHLTATERRLFRRHQSDVARQQHALAEQMNERLSRATDLVFAEWLERRASSSRWVDDDVCVTS